MNMGKPALFAISISLCAGVVAAPVYKSVDENGNVVYTDDPGREAKPVDLPPLSTYPAPKFQPIDRDDVSRDEPGNAGYSSLQITQPEQDATVRDNTGAVNVQAVLKPQLQEAAGHRYRFYLDGKAMGEPQRVPSTSFANIDRGAHQVEVAVVDAVGNELKRSDSVRF